LSDGSTKTVTVSNRTAFDDESSGLSGLKVGDHVEVEGVAQPDGTFAARYVELSDHERDQGDDHSGACSDSSEYD
jgi:hypothetical protein